MTAQQNILELLSKRPATVKEILAVSTQKRPGVQMKLMELLRLGVIKREAIQNDLVGRPAYRYEVAA